MKNDCWVEHIPPRVIIKFSYSNAVTKKVGKRLEGIGAVRLPDFKAWSLPIEDIQKAKDCLDSLSIDWVEVKVQSYEDCCDWFKDIFEL